MKPITAACDLPAAKNSHYKWLLALVMVAVIALGWRFPLLGFIVPAAMGAGIAGGFLRGRWVCGNACPRGSFLDSWFHLISGHRAIPSLLKNAKFRGLVLSALMSFMFLRLSQNPTSIEHWGLVFWHMCAVTTVVAVALGVRYSARSWCVFCPVGTLSGTAGKEKHSLQVSSSCRECGYCERHCPMQLDIARYRHTGHSVEKDCIKCSACISACPRKGVLSWPEQKAA